ncbi:hypothetical protein ACSVDA_06530 [Cytobacillus sp. Hm23]
MKAYRIDLYYIDDGAERDIYETHVISTFEPKYNREKVYVNSSARADELYNLEHDIDALASELEELQQELKFQDWHNNKYNGCSSDYIQSRNRVQEVKEEILLLNRRKAEIIRKYFK